MHFFASRLKYSRWVEVTLVPDERVETLVRALVDHLAAFGGIPLVAVFDRPKTVALKWGRDGVVTEWNPTFAGVALDLGLGVEVCWPYRPQEKGSVENLVGWVKGSFFKQRRFLDREDLERQLREWLTEANTDAAVARDRRAAGGADRRGARAAAPAEDRAGGSGAADPRERQPDGRGDPRRRIRTRCRPTRSACRARCISIAIACASSPAASAPSMRGNSQPGAGSILPEHRAQRVAAVSGKRARRYLQRQHLLDLGAGGAWRISPSSRIGARRSWIHDVERLHALLQTHGDAALRARLRARPRRAGDRRRVHRALSRHADARRCRLTTADRPPTIAAPRCRAQAGSRSPKAPAGAERSGAPGRGRARRHRLAASEAGHDRRRSPISMRSSSGCISPMRDASGATSCSAPSARRWSYRDFLTLLVDRGDRASAADAARAPHATRALSVSQDDRRFQLHVSVDAAAAHARLGARARLRHRRPVADLRPANRAAGRRTWPIADRVPRHPERLRRLLHDRRHAHRRSLGRLSRRRSSPQALPTYTHPAVLVVDEVGYLTYGTDAANMLFHVVNERHRRHRADDLHDQQSR